MKYIIIVIIVLILIFYYNECHKESAPSTCQPTIVVDKGPQPEEEEVENFMDWNEQVAEKSIDPSIVKSHRQYTSNVRQFSSGANFTQISDDNTSGVFTNFIGFSRPRYVEQRPGLRTVFDVDDSVLKRNKHMVFKSDY